MILVNIIAIVGMVVGFGLISYRKKAILAVFHSFILVSLAGLGAINLFTIQNEFSQFAAWSNQTFAKEPETVFHFSQQGKNVLVIMLDRAVSSYLPYIFEENPKLYADFSGFTFFPNCVSFGVETIKGMTPIFGGYEYTPYERNKKDTELLVDEHNQALLLLPRLFREQQFSVTVTNPRFANYSSDEPDLRIFDEYGGIKSANIIGKFSDYWMIKHQNLHAISISEVLTRQLVRFSFFKFAPLLLRPIIYDNGRWLGAPSSEKFSKRTLDHYAVLDLLPEISEITDDDTNTYTAIVNDLPHEPAFLETPGYTPADEPMNKGNGPFADEQHFHVNSASLLLLGQFFNWLKSQNCYENTRIIITADHGWPVSVDSFPVLPDGVNSSFYNPLLLFKDFNAEGMLLTDMTFMTNADVPLLAVKDIISEPVNPFTGVPLQAQKENGVVVTSSRRFSFRKYDKYQFDIKDTEWLYVHDDIFKPENWERAKY
ncbi:hypothetical protein FACS1894163_07000 [Spirochaetia bacterium]|nr:hypothetical protein FACS1894163_07000 [Spirochaetia bacterium]